MLIVTRRSFLASSSALVASPLLTRLKASPAPAHDPGSRDLAVALSPSFPTQEPDLVREMVSVSHGNLARVKELVALHPAMARAAWDWGYGDWEDALGAASHVGHHEIAAVLLANGARPTMYSAAMLGQVDVVKAFITASPGIQRTKGPHGITLMAHAVNGGPGAVTVVEYLRSVGDADAKPATEDLSAEQMDTLVGTYTFGSASDERMEVSKTSGAKPNLQITRAGRVPRGLAHVGALAFFPAGAEAVRIRFTESATGITLTIHDPDVVLTAVKGK